MGTKHKHDPVNAISESDATGRTAELFAEIRELMQIPIVTSIWRTLDAVPGGLESVWAATSSIMKTSEMEILLKKLDTEIEFPTPAKLSAQSVDKILTKPTDRSAILDIFKAYNRSNGMNLIALTAFVRGAHVTNRTSVTSDNNASSKKKAVAGLVPLLPRYQIKPDHWKFLEKTSFIGLKKDNGIIPTIWRHLIHWPDLIELLLIHYASLHEKGSLFVAIKELTDFVETEAPKLARFADYSIPIPEAAMTMISNYIGHPPSVCRMNTVGRSVEKWFTMSI